MGEDFWGFLNAEKNRSREVKSGMVDAAAEQKSAKK